MGYDHKKHSSQYSISCDGCPTTIHGECASSPAFLVVQRWFKKEGSTEYDQLSEMYFCNLDCLLKHFTAKGARYD